MNVLFNVFPHVEFAVDEAALLGEFDLGFACQVRVGEAYAVLAFRDVDDHIDGNGLVAVWMLNGSGTFYQGDASVDLSQGDLLVFDDRIEHSFESNSLCIAVNFTIEGGASEADLRRLVTSFNIH